MYPSLPVPLVQDGRTVCHSPNILIPVTKLVRCLLGEEHWRLKVIPNTFGANAVLKLMFGALIRTTDR